MIKWWWGFVLICVALGAQASSCSDQHVRLQILGSGGPELSDGRASSSYLVWRDGKAVVMIDTGPGSSVAFGDSGARFEDIQVIALTHLHVDHSADLPAFVKGAFFTPRNTDLPLYGPGKNALMPATSEFAARLFGPRGAFPYLADNLDPALGGDFVVRAKDMPLGNSVPYLAHDQDGIRLLSMPVHHGPVAAVAWRVEVGTCVLGFSGDMSNRHRRVSRLFKGADVLVLHNAVPQGVGGVARRLHMPPSEIGVIAEQAGAKQLILSHRMRRSLGRESSALEVIRAAYSGRIAFAEDGQIFALASRASVVVE